MAVMKDMIGFLRLEDAVIVAQNAATDGRRGLVKSAQCNAVTTGLIKVVNVQYVEIYVPATTGVTESAVLVDMNVNTTGKELPAIPVG